MTSHPTFSELRERMVANQIEGRGLRDPRLLEVMRHVPRHQFVSSEHWDNAYEDGPLPTQFNQTISQPYIVALMTFLLHLRGTEKVLEIGTGSGYQAAVLSYLAREVHTVEYYNELAEHAREVLAQLDIHNVTVHVGDGSLGLPEFAPYEGILVAAAAPRAPRPLLDQLALGGRLVVPVGSPKGQDLQVWERTETGLEMEEIAPVAFVPLRGAFGWNEEEWREKDL